MFLTHRQEANILLWYVVIAMSHILISFLREDSMKKKKICIQRKMSVMQLLDSVQVIKVASYGNKERL